MSNIHVTQVDVEASAPFQGSWPEREVNSDDLPQAFARHRQATLASVLPALEEAREALRNLIDQCVSCEKELTEELHRADFCGESLPLCDARQALATLTEQIERMRNEQG